MENLKWEIRIIAFALMILAVEIGYRSLVLSARADFGSCDMGGVLGGLNNITGELDLIRTAIKQHK